MSSSFTVFAQQNVLIMALSSPRTTFPVDSLIFLMVYNVKSLSFCATRNSIFVGGTMVDFPFCLVGVSEVA